MTWTTADIPDQHGRTAVVTGANGGLGLATARSLAAAGARVVMAVRDVDKAQTARGDVLGDVPDAELEVRPLDLASLDSVRACADGIVADHGHVDLLINNAGVMGIPERHTDDGFEMQLAVNHLGHFVLTSRLFPALVRAPAARVVSVTSFARFVGRTIDPADPHQRRSYDPWTAYGRSKLANLQFAVELHRRLEQAGLGISSLAAHPGLSHTGLQAHSVAETAGGLSQRFWHLAARTVGQRPEDGALPQLRAATDPAARSGRFYAPRWFTFGPPVERPLFGRSVDERAGRVLWEVSERETGERFELPTATDVS